MHAKRAHLLKQSLNKDAPYYYLPGESKFSDLKPELEVQYKKLLADDHEFLWQAVSDFDSLKKGDYIFIPMLSHLVISTRHIGLL